MMPIDPFFTSGDKTLAKAERDRARRVAYAKKNEYQHTINCCVPKHKKKQAFWRMMETHRYGDYYRLRTAAGKGGGFAVSGPGHPSITGFKSPHKTWSEKRGTSSN